MFCLCALDRVIKKHVIPKSGRNEILIAGPAHALHRALSEISCFNISEQALTTPRDSNYYQLPVATKITAIKNPIVPDTSTEPSL